MSTSYDSIVVAQTVTFIRDGGVVESLRCVYVGDDAQDTCGRSVVHRAIPNRVLNMLPSGMFIDSMAGCVVSCCDLEEHKIYAGKKALLLHVGQSKYDLLFYS